MSSSTESLTAIDLFSGCGGLSLGLKRAGFDVIAAVENEPVASATFKKNHPETELLEQDITTIKPSYLRTRLRLNKGELDLLAGCPPCQGFSKLWTMNGSYMSDDPINDLVLQFQKFVSAFLPKAVMMENVPGLASDSRHTQFCRFIQKLGYNFETRVLDAADFGVPQRRRRMILIAHRGIAPKFARKGTRTKSVENAIRELSVPGDGNDPLHDYSVERSIKVRNRIRKIPKNGGSRGDLPKAAQLKCHKKNDGFRDIYGRMSWQKPSPTITGGCINPSKGRFLHPEQDRAITLREAALLQGFPKTYEFDMTRGRYHSAQMIGNAFPPMFAERHARVVASSIRKASLT